MRLLNNALKLVCFCTLCLTFSYCAEKKIDPEIVYKIPDPLREGIRRNKVESTKIYYINVDSNGKLIPENYYGYLEYDTFGNISYDNLGAWLNEHRYKYDENGFRKILWYNGCNTSREAAFFLKSGENELTERLIYLKDVKWKSSIDTTNYYTIIPKGYIYNFNSKGNLISIKFEDRVNLTYQYDSLDKLLTIIDSVGKLKKAFGLPIKKEFLYTLDGSLVEINEISISHLISTANVNSKGLIDTIKYFNQQRKLEKLEVYEYKY